MSSGYEIFLVQVDLIRQIDTTLVVDKWPLVKIIDLHLHVHCLGLEVHKTSPILKQSIGRAMSVDDFSLGEFSIEVHTYVPFFA